MRSWRYRLCILTLGLVFFILGGCGKVTLESLMEETITNLDQKSGMRETLSLHYQDEDQILEVQAKHRIMFDTVDSYGEMSLGGLTPENRQNGSQEIEVYTERVVDGLARYVGVDGEWTRDMIDVPVNFVNTHLSAILEALEAERFATRLDAQTQAYEGKDCYVIRATVDGEDLEVLQQRVWDFALSAIGEISLPEDWMTAEPMAMVIYIEQEHRLISGIELENAQCQMAMHIEGYDNVSEDDVAVLQGIRASVDWRETELAEEESAAVQDSEGNFILATDTEQAFQMKVCPPEDYEYTMSSQNTLSYDQDDLSVTYTLHNDLQANAVQQSVADFSYLQAEDMKDYSSVTVDKPVMLDADNGKIYYVKAQYVYQKNYKGTEIAAWMELKPGVYVSVKVEEFLEADENSSINEEMIRTLFTQIETVEA